MNETTTERRRRHPLLSLAIVRESVRSNWLSFLITSFGNVVIGIVVILILSTLGLNTLQDSLSQLFSSADMLSLVGQGSISYYLAYSNAVELHKGSGPFVTEFEEEFSELIPVSMEFEQNLSESRLLQETVRSLLFDPYVTHYEQAEGTDEERHRQAVDETLNAELLSTLTALVPSLSGLSEETTTLFLTSCLDEGHDVLLSSASFSADELDVPAVVEAGMDRGIRTLLLSYGATEGKIEDFLARMDECKVIYEESGRLSEEQIRSLFLFGVEAIAPTGMESALSRFATSLLEARDRHPEEYRNNTALSGHEFGYADESLFAAIEELLSDLLGSYSYLAALPDFTVGYLTDDLGRPYAIEDGEKVVLTTYDPSRMIPVADGMYVHANLLEKMHKLELTGTDYTEEEIALAREEGLQEVQSLVHDVDLFLKDMVRREGQGEDLGYYLPSQDGAFGEVDGDKILPSILEALEKRATEAILSAFGVDDIEEVGRDDEGVSGTQLLEFVQNQCVGAIGSFELYLGDGSLLGGSTLDQTMAAMVKASQGILDNLPASVEESFLELSEMNMYGIFIGIMFFGLAGLLLPMVFLILTSNELVAQKVENGSLAFTLSAPLKRSTVLFSKAFSLFLAVASMSLVLLLGSLAARAIGISIGGEDFEQAFSLDMLLRFVLGNFFCMFAISGICFLSSSSFSKTKYALGIGGGITIFFLVCAILGLFGGPAMPSTIRIDSMNFFNYLTILSFYDASAAMNNDPVFYYKLIALLGIGLVTYGLSFLVFEKKDLPL